MGTLIFVFPLPLCYTGVSSISGLPGFIEKTKTPINLRRAQPEKARIRQGDPAVLICFYTGVSVLHKKKITAAKQRDAIRG